MHNTPGSPWNSEGRQMSYGQRQELNAKFGLDQPLPVQYLRWLGALVSGDMGLTVTQRPIAVARLIGSSVWPTVQLGLMAFALAVLLGVPLGLIAAIRHG